MALQPATRGEYRGQHDSWVEALGVDEETTATRGSAYNTDNVARKVASFGICLHNVMGVIIWRQPRAFSSLSGIIRMREHWTRVAEIAAFRRLGTHPAQAWGAVAVPTEGQFYVEGFISHKVGSTNSPLGLQLSAAETNSA